MTRLIVLYPRTWRDRYKLAPEQFQTADFNDAITEPVFQSGRLGIQYDVARHALLLISSTPRRASASARSFSTCPAWPRTQHHSIL